MVIHARTFVPSTTDRALGGSIFERSLRINSDDNPKLYHTTSSTSNTFTISIWMKPTRFKRSYRHIFSSYADSFMFNNDFRIRYNDEGSGSAYSSGKYRNLDSWYHFVMAVNSSGTTVYVNGETIITSSYNFSLNNGSEKIRFIWFPGDVAEFTWDGYIADAYLIDGQAKAPTDFGYTDSQTGIWRAKKYEGTYGSGGLHLEFKDSSAIGKDTSGNGNDFTTENLAASDIVLDTPTNNFATLNFLSSGLSWANINEGNLKLNPTNNAWTPVSSSMVMSSGKWYWEVYVENVGSYTMAGILPALRQDDRVNHDDDRYPGSFSDEWGYANNGDLHNSATTTSSWGATYTTGDIISFALDMDAGTMNVYKNGSATGSQITGISAVKPSNFARGEYRANLCPYGTSAKSVINFGQDGTFAGNKTAQNNKDLNGIGNFFYSVPTGFKALCSENLRGSDNPYIIKPQKHFDTILYTGQDTSSLYNVTGLEFAPDLIWAKARNDTIGHIFIDRVRGDDKQLEGNISDAEVVRGTPSYRFLKDGFAVSTGGNMNNPVNYAAWCWKAGGGSTVTNNDGNNTSQVSVNTEAGFSILTYTGNGTNNSNITMGHGLGKTPAWVIIKNRSSTADWVVWVRGIGGSATDNQKNLGLNTSSAAGQNSDQFRYADATTIQVRSTDSTNGKVNKNGDNYVAYCWAEIPGYSKFGSYEGNGAGHVGGDHGVYVHCGFTPALVIYKKYGGSDNWEMHDNKRDTYNPVIRQLFPNTSGAEASSTNIDFVNNGFKHRNSNGNTNESGEKYVFMAFADKPSATAFNSFPNAR